MTEEQRSLCNRQPTLPSSLLSLSDRRILVISSALIERAKTDC